MRTKAVNFNGADMDFVYVNGAQVIGKGDTAVREPRPYFFKFINAVGHESIMTLADVNNAGFDCRWGCNWCFGGNPWGLYFCGDIDISGIYLWDAGIFLHGHPLREVIYGDETADVGSLNLSFLELVHIDVSRCQNLMSIDCGGNPLATLRIPWVAGQHTIARSAEHFQNPLRVHRFIGSSARVQVQGAPQINPLFIDDLV